MVSREDGDDAGEQVEDVAGITGLAGPVEEPDRPAAQPYPRQPVKIKSRPGWADQDRRWIQDQVSLGVLVTAVPREAVDEAVAACGVEAKRSDGKLPAHVTGVFDDGAVPVPRR